MGSAVQKLTLETRISGSYRTAELSEGLFGPIALNRESRGRLLSRSLPIAHAASRRAEIGLIMGDTIPMIFVTYLLK